MNELPTGTVTLLLADVEGSTRLWETQPEQMGAAIAHLDRVIDDAIGAYHGVRPVEQGEGDSFVIAFARASDAVACALELQRAPLSPIRLRIGVHTGEVRLRDEGNYIGPTINRTARLRDMAHGGQTVLSGAAEDMVVDRLPEGSWLTDLGTHQLRDVPRPERVVQICHPDLRNEFPPLRTVNNVAVQGLPTQLTSFVGRAAQVDEVCGLLTDNRLVTLTGAGGVGKTRLAIAVATQTAADFGGGAWYVDLAPITHPGLAPVRLARVLGLPDQPGRPTMDTLLSFLSGRRALVVLDNCEHLLDATAALVVGLVEACPAIRLLATSREPIGVAGEVSWRVPSLSLSDEAIELFTDRARRARADFRLTDANAAAVTEVCARLDGLPLAIELAAARVRAQSLSEILDGLYDRFRLLTGGSRTTVRRQQTLRASVDWSHALLTETERILFRRLAVFLGGLDLAAAQAVAGGRDVERYQILDQLTLLVDKSLVVADDSSGRTRYRMLETMRQYALEKLAESGEADTVRACHRDHYAAIAALLDNPGRGDFQQRLDQAETEIDNLRAAFAWSRENCDIEQGLTLASSLQSLWVTRGRYLEGRAWFDAVLTDENAGHLEVAAGVRARALADKAVLDVFVDAAASIDNADRALAIARQVDDPAVLVRALTAYGFVAGQVNDHAAAQPYFTEALGLARALEDPWRLSLILAWQANAALAAGNPIATRMTAEEGCELADAIGDRYSSVDCRLCLGFAKLAQGDLTGAIAELGAAMDATDASRPDILKPAVLQMLGAALAYHGEVSAARSAGVAALDAAAELGQYFLGLGYATLAIAALAAGDVAHAREMSEETGQQLSAQPQIGAFWRAYIAQAALADQDLSTARRWAEDAVLTTTGFHQVNALTARTRVAIAHGELDAAERDAHAALTCAMEIEAYLSVPDILECLADLSDKAGRHNEGGRLAGAAEAMRQRLGVIRFKIYQAGYDISVASLRDALGENVFESVWAEGAALSTNEAIAYAQRGRGERKRPATGWASLTPAELDVVRLVSEGLANKDIATRLFVSPRTVQAHLTHAYTKLGLSSRVQLAQEAAHHA
ncbi:LuxR family transcriptional regulator [Mycobacterium sp. CBMA293]|uniref:helix-turn-helix transcriptional regulator n=1 Tax=unclassified Mycolicibacterium TaxID=2636767 RepID=UPI0012DEB15C|nr:MULTISPECIES: LuxR family transcriptional regulator [unclassified Mycolicibacterium]MUL49873.1 LuxR family transcriptional regulator [Mycolicibacterium sp. CBMA 360]MUL61493.1 LuxR family transcriptional regulator [Mycolicibacterium sp. CBMA 335]MUL74228.1 LuxR family transcriptional regulator [Mycolicibacterium sp. CBMA 311]MUL97146.1 LuxR family transcriptional regulator [Mycolicibacterium sp. CBMA 230]MUM08208.1 LuxR family transcriptional regulator [Mycolicibacterium sp. CBMA 213]